MPSFIPDESLEIAPLVADRWSPKMFSADALTRHDLLRLFEAARWAPSSYNEQPWRFVAGLKGHGDAYDKLLSVLVDTNQAWAKTAPALVLVVAKKTLSLNDKPNRFSSYDTGQAIGILSMQAGTMGLYLRQIGGYDKQLAIHHFNIPDDYEPMAVMAIGYLDGDYASESPGSATYRTRKPLHEISFGDFWGQSF
jgi:nitroreductase